MARKLAQLCAQVHDAIRFALAGAADSRLRELLVQEVRPAPDGARLGVVLMLVRGCGAARDVNAPHRGSTAEEWSSWQDDIDAAYDALRKAGPWLRRQVASEIHRKRTPELAFQVLVAQDDTFDETEEVAS
ncbi:MAG: hypothetical protein R3B13_25385 [Polyangiaceae bacterium]